MTTEISDVLLLFIIFIIMIVCHKIISPLFNKIGTSELVGWIILGIIFVCPLIGGTSIAELLKIGHVSEHEGSLHCVIETISTLGVVLLIFSVSLKISIKDIMSVGKTASFVAIFGVLIPFIFGFIFIMIFYDHNLDHALFLAASMVATSVGITAYVIQELHLLHTKEAKTIIGAAIIDDILGIIVLTAVCFNTKSGDAYNINDILLYAIALIITIALLIYLIIPCIQKNIRKNSIKLIISIILCIALAWMTTKIHLAAIIGAFIAGSILFKYAETWELNKKIEFFTNLLLPFFFVCVGLHIDIHSVNNKTLLTIAIVAALAIFGKYFGCFTGAKISDKSMSTESASIIGIGMIPRGEVGIVVASIGLKITAEGGGLPNELYTAVVFMCVITTMVAPPLLSMLFKRKYGNNMKLEK